MEIKNELYPIFLKTDQLRILVVGGGYVALEKLSFLFKSSPHSVVTILSPMLRIETEKFIREKKIYCITAEYDISYLEGQHLVIATTDKPDVNKQVYDDCRTRNILVNVADTPPLCDFYMGGIVTKGHLKIAISSNGKSPTLTKRIRQWLEGLLPDETDDLLESLSTYRKTLGGNFQYKLKKMNQLTKTLLHQNSNIKF